MFDRSGAANEPIQIEDARSHIAGWDLDNRKHDAEFLDQPVARARRVRDHVAGSLVLAGEVWELPLCAADVEAKRRAAPDRRASRLPRHLAPRCPAGR